MSVLSLLQIAHLALLFVIPISFALLRLISGSEDATVKKLGVVVGLGGVAWASSLTIGAIIYGSKEPLLRSLWTSYRRLLSAYPFLVLSVAIFILAETFLLWNLVFYRPIKFYSTQDVMLLLNDKVGEVRQIGTLKSGVVTKIRLKIGVRYIAYQTVKDGRVRALPPIEVPAWWSAKPLQIIRIPGVKPYESL
ncbi:MAG: hypothetical protein DRG59_08675 [Deltaproteobacteria bacterium]|nr:MAG: hypothetical protein DRG83_14210 [Deltaproteobacteria bacterium]RLB05776.1 MAG: hypothetical protein DRG59_08675 [Deltaproteobacteria bacterium]